MCSWYEEMTLQFLSQARAMRSALVKRLYCAVCAVFVVSCHKKTDQS